MIPGLRPTSPAVTGQHPVTARNHYSPSPGPPTHPRKAHDLAGRHPEWPGRLAVVPTVSLRKKPFMSGSVQALFRRLTVLLGFQSHSYARRETWETRHVATFDEAIRKVRELYPNAVSGPWQRDGTGWLPTAEVMCIWPDQETRDRKSPPIAGIRRYTP